MAGTYLNLPNLYITFHIVYLFHSVFDNIVPLKALYSSRLLVQGNKSLEEKTRGQRR